MGYGCRVQDAYPVCAFSRGRVRSSVLGVRSSASIRYRVSGPRCRVPGTRQGNRAIRRNAWLTLRKPAHGVCTVRDEGGGRVSARGPNGTLRQYGQYGQQFITRHLLLVTRCLPRVRVFRRQVPGTGYQVSGTGYLAPGTWYPPPEPVRRRGPNTEHRRPSAATGKRAHRVCLLLVIPSLRPFSGGPDLFRRDQADRLLGLPEGRLGDGPSLLGTVVQDPEEVVPPGLPVSAAGLDRF
jgi:hypothetical protein